MLGSVNAAPFQPGDVLGGYEVLSLLGRGGMGVVYRARRRGGPGEVALKTLLAPPGSEEADRFRREVELLAAVRHPSIVPVYSAGEEKGVLFYAMGIVEGESLEAKIRREGRLPLEEAVRILTEVALAVAAAHAQQIVHRDLKPANVLLDAEGHAYVTDFGLGRQLGQESGQSLTRTGEVLGTPWFMPPEQALGYSKQTDARADVYGLGAILYCALAGRPPFIGATALETIRLVRERPPDPIEDLPPAFDELLARALAKSPEDRPPTALDFASELRDALHARRALSKSLVRALVLTAAACVFVTAALVHRVLDRRRHPLVDAAAPSPVASVAAVASHANPRLDSAVQLLAEHRLPSIDAFHGFKQTLVSPSTSDPERARIRALFDRAQEVAAEGDESRFLELARLELPPPKDPAVRHKIAHRWCVLAAASAPNEPVDLQAVAAGLTGSASDQLQAYLGKIREFGPTFARLVHARAVDPEVPLFPPELEPFFVRVLIGANLSPSPDYGKAWGEALRGLEDHPLQDYVTARCEIWNLDHAYAEHEDAVMQLRCRNLLKVGHTEAQLLTLAGEREHGEAIDQLWLKEHAARPEDPDFREVQDACARLDTACVAKARQLAARALDRAEHAAPLLAAAGGSPGARDLAELFLFEVLRRTRGLADNERVIHAFDRFGGLCRPESQDYARPYADAHIHYLKGDVAGGSGSDLESVISQANGLHQAHMSGLFQELAHPSTTPSAR